MSKLGAIANGIENKTVLNEKAGESAGFSVIYIPFDYCTKR